MVDNVFIFGDSFMYGEESEQHEFDQEQFLQEMAEVIGRPVVKLTKTGRPSTALNAKEIEKYKEWFINKCCKAGLTPQYNSIGAMIARKVNAPYVMKALSGNSNNSIYKTFLDCLPDMTSDSLVVFGISQPNRKTYYDKWTAGHQSTHITNCWATIDSQKDYIKFTELDMMYGDDVTAQVLSTYSFITSVKQLSPCPVLLIDPFHNFCDNKYHPDVPWDYVKKYTDDWDNYNHKKLLEYLEKEFKNLFTYGISEVFEEVTDNGYPLHCINGHYSKYVYELYVDKVLMKDVN